MADLKNNLTKTLAQSSLNHMKIELEPRKCVVCQNPFKVMPTSKQKHCSLICKDDPKFIQRLKESGFDPERSKSFDEDD